MKLIIILYKGCNFIIFASFNILIITTQILSTLQPTILNKICMLAILHEIEILLMVSFQWIYWIIKIKKTLFFFFKIYHILIVLSKEPEIIYLLLQVTAKVVTSFKCPFNTFVCLFLKDFTLLLSYLQNQKQNTYNRLWLLHIL